ncbi:MAG: LysR family transcriptional regulator [Alphaproteobacteria bacterium]|nr:LysR family transcriptional regulator [Alphaproteobacteria bacterium]
MDWDKLRVFHAVAEAGSLTHAGEILNLSQSAVSRQISALEESLGVPLFHRHARGLMLTEQGEQLYQTAKEIFAKLAMAEAMLVEGRETPKGPLKVTTTVAFGSEWLTPRLKSFLDLYPEITLTLILDDDDLDLSMREADVAIRMSPERQPDLIQRHLTTISTSLYAAPAYLKEHGLPESIEDLANHRLVVHGEEGHPPFPDVNWLLRLVNAAGGARQTLTINNTSGIFRAILDGLGVGSLPDYLVPADGSLIRVLTAVEGPKVPAYFLYPEELRHSKRIAVLRDFLLKQVDA